METEIDCKKEKELFFSYMWIFAVGAIFLLLIWWLYYDNKSDKKKIEEARGFYEIIDQINKFSDIVWFNRHKNREYQIMNGEIEVVSSDMYDAYNLHISELPDSDAGVVPDTFAMRFSRV